MMELPSSAALSTLGLLTSTYIALRLTSFLSTYFLPSRLSTYRHQTRPSYALITGATAGIGFGLAEELCSRNYNVILHGRDRNKLLAAQSALKKTYPSVETRILVADAVNFDSSVDAMRELLAPLQDLHIPILINNVGGTGSTQPTPFQAFGKHTPAEIDGLISVNDRFATHLTLSMLPLLQKSAPALVMNMSSYAVAGVSHVAVYSGTKGYLSSWGAALRPELRVEGYNIDVMNIVVGAVKSQQNGGPPNLMTPSSRRMAQSIIDRIGCGKGTVVAYFPHALQMFFIGLLPNGLREWALARQTKTWYDTKAKEW